MTGREASHNGDENRPYGKRQERFEEIFPRYFYISGIIYKEIEKICRRRIRENDPTPARF